MPVAKIILVNEGKTAEIDLVNEKFDGTMSTQEAKHFLLLHLNKLIQIGVIDGARDSRPADVSTNRQA